MTGPIIETDTLSKDFHIYLRQRGLLGAVRTLFSTARRTVHAVNRMTMSIARGEVVGLVGANGAGKSTTIKMLTGILVPTAGAVRVCGLVPYRQRQANAQRIGVVFGQRTQLLWDLPLVESFDVLRWIYGLERAPYEARLRDLVDRLDVKSFLDAPVRTLSLGQRMKGDLIASLLHDPEILFLDEPTIGLDVVTRDVLLDYIQDLNRTRGTTILFTSHDLITLEKLCDRVLVLDRGEVVFDGTRTALRNLYGADRVVVVEYRNRIDRNAWPVGLAIQEGDERRVSVAFNPERERLQDLLVVLERSGEIIDIAVSAPTVESVVKRLLADSTSRPNQDS